MEVFREVKKLEAWVEILADALHAFKAEERDGAIKELKKDIVEWRISAIYYLSLIHI